MNTSTKTLLQIQNLTRKYPSPDGGEPLTVFENANFDIQKGEFVCIIGHSGCGKSTILNVLAGLDTATSGAVIMDGREVSGPSLDRGVVFQNYSLLPWMSALKNVMFGVKARFPDWTRKQVKDHSYKHLNMVGLGEGAELRKPSQLSGGMRQRVGLARALSVDAQVLLLDEPFSAVDEQTRRKFQEDLLALVENENKTFIFVTHSIEEAVYVSDQIAILLPRPSRVHEVIRPRISRNEGRGNIRRNTEYLDIVDEIWASLRSYVE